MKVIYNGFFLDEKSVSVLIEKSKNILLEKPVKNPHVTFEFKPKSGFDKRNCQLVVDGIGSNADNQGFRVQIPKELLALYNGAKVPHITLSLSATGKPVNTKDVEFEDIEPFTVTGYLGSFIN